MGVQYLTAYKTHPKIIRANQGGGGEIQQKTKKQSINIKRDEINIMNIINDNTFIVSYHDLVIVIQFTI